MAKDWQDDIEQLNLFYQEVAQDMVARRMLRTLPDDAIGNDAVLACVADFIAEVSPLHLFPTLSACMTSFMGWMRGSAIEPNEKAQRIYAEITRQFGDVALTFGYGADFEVKSNGQRRAAFAYCVNQCERQFDANMNDVMILTRSGVTGDAAKPQDTFIGDLIVVESKDGKLYYKITGGQFTKYGVRVWPEVLAEAGIPTEKLEGGKNYKLGRVCHYSLKPDGKPEKVISIATG